MKFLWLGLKDAMRLEESHLSYKSEYKTWIKLSSSKPEQKLHRSTEGFKVDQIVHGSLVLHMAEDGHSDNCIDESDECQ